jgi:hypothetical protein
VAPAQQLVVTETTPGGVLHGCNFAVEIRGALGGQIERVPIVRGVAGMAAVTVATGQTWAVTTTVLDPDAQCLAFNAASFTTPPRHAPGWSPWLGSGAR